MSIELKIKSKSLAAESRIIRSEEIRLKGLIKSRTHRQLDASKLQGNREHLYFHRIRNVRDEARATFIARAYLKGLSRSAVEAKPIFVDTAKEVERLRSFKIATKYSKTAFTANQFKDWLVAP